MENATKALLIAASVLIAIVLIAVGIKILGSTKGVTDQVEDLSSTMETSMFNSQYTQYAGTQKGTVVKELLNKIISHNEQYPYGTLNREKKVIKVYAVNCGITCSGGYATQKLSDLREKINMSKSYTIDVNTTPTVTAKLVITITAIN